MKNSQLLAAFLLFIYVINSFALPSNKKNNPQTKSASSLNTQISKKKIEADHIKMGTKTHKINHTKNTNDHKVNKIKTSENIQKRSEIKKRMLGLKNKAIKLD